MDRKPLFKFIQKGPIRTQYRWFTLFILFSAALVGMNTHGTTNSPPNRVLKPVMDPYWRTLGVSPSIYESPYRIALFNPQNGEDGARTWSQTKSMFTYGLGVITFFAVLPEDFTGWDTDADILNKYIENVKEGPVWDRDKWYINYIGHTYVGGVYYQVARKSGYRQWDSFIYSTLMSTFYWEYGVEAFAEVPSIQDLVVTPILGWVYGEWSYQTEIRIRNNENEVLGSTMLGETSLFFLDPIDSLGRGINRLVGRNWIKSGYGYFTYNAIPSGNEIDHQVYLHMRMPLGVSGPTEPVEARAINTYEKDPVGTGVVGLSYGRGYTMMDDKWGMEDGSYDKFTLGLYFTSRTSCRLAYAKGALDEKATGRSRTYENYSIDTQVYLNKKNRIRPFVTAGFGEQLWDEQDDMDTFQINGGIGLHCKLHNKWSLQADWTNYFAPHDDRSDQQFNAGLIYRFGRGEHDSWM